MKRLLRSKLVLTITAFIMIAAAVIIPLSGSITHSFAASRSSHNIAYVNYDDSGFTGNSVRSGNIFADAVVGGPSPTTSSTASVTFNGMTFTPLTKAALSTSSLAPFDTLILFEVCDIGTNFTASQHAAINAYLAAGNKILLYDADRCAPISAGGGAAGSANYSWFTFPFSTSNPGPKGASGTLTIVEKSTLTQGLASDPFNSDELGDANTATTSDPHWFAAAKTTNALGVSGFFLAYARNKGLIIYDGADHWNTFSPTKSLTDLFLNELNQQYNPDNLPSTTPIAAKHQVLFVLLQGINTSLSKEDAKDNGALGTIPDFVNEARFGPRGSIHIPGIVPFLKAHGYGKAQFLAYSYSVSNPANGHPLSYDCLDTFSNTLQDDAIRLSIQINNFLKTEPKNTITDIYLIGHSLGGVVALTYLTALVKAQTTVLPLPTNSAQLKGVITLDSPVGGVSGQQKFLEDIFAIFQDKFPLPGCSLLDSMKQMVSVSELVKIFNTTSKSTHPPTDDGNPGSQGAHASILKAIFGGEALTNQAVMEAAAGLGTAVLTIGNTMDFLYNPGACLPGRPTFTSSQWIGDEGPFDAAKEHHSPLKVYGREFTAGLPCFNALDDLINHRAVYNNTDVETALTQFLPNGAAPTALTIAPPEP